MASGCSYDTMHTVHVLLRSMLYREEYNLRMHTETQGPTSSDSRRHERYESDVANSRRVSQVCSVVFTPTVQQGMLKYGIEIL